MLILWSGGFDSTLLLLQLAREHTNTFRKIPDKTGSYGSRGQWVRALSIIHPQVSARREHLRARMNIQEWFRTRFNNVEFATLHLQQDDTVCEWFEGMHLTQPQIWFSMALPYLRKDDDLYLGYIKGDCIWHYKEHLFKGFEHWQQIRGAEGKLKTPLEHTTKEQVITEVRKEEGLEELCWYCEIPSPKGVPCRRCGSCHAHLSALGNLERIKADHTGEMTLGPRRA